VPTATAEVAAEAATAVAEEAATEEAATVAAEEAATGVVGTAEEEGLVAGGRVHVTP